MKVSDFTARDKTHILDLFVNNERTLLKIYEALFPHRAAPATGQQSGVAQPASNLLDSSFTASVQQQVGRGENRSQGGIRGGLSTNYGP